MAHCELLVLFVHLHALVTDGCCDVSVRSGQFEAARLTHGPGVGGWRARSLRQDREKNSRAGPTSNKQLKPREAVAAGPSFADFWN